MQKTTLRLALVVLLFAAVTSCRKTNKQDTERVQSTELVKLSSAVGARPAFPNVENGMLVFKTQQEFDDYIKYLDKVTDPQNYDSATLREKEFDQDAILGAIETQLGFTSIRKISHDKFMALNEIGWDRLEDIPEEHFIHDMELKSVLNENLTVKVGTNYLHVINKNLSVKVDANADPKILQAFIKLPVTATLQDALNIDHTHKYSTITEISKTGNSNIFEKGPGIPGIPLGEGDVTIQNLRFDGDDCSNATFKTFTNMVLYQDLGPNSPVYIGPGNTLPGTFTIDFGDNSPRLTIHTLGANNSYWVPQFTHNYPGPGLYKMKIHAVADWVYGGARNTQVDRNEDINVAGSCKSPDEKEGAEEFFPVPDDSRAVSGKITVTKDFFNFWGNVDDIRIIAETSSWLRDGNRWKQSKSEIWDKLHADRKDKGCNIIGQTDGDGWSSNSKHITVHRTDPNYFWQKVNTEHGIKYHNVWYVHNKVIYACD